MSHVLNASHLPVNYYCLLKKEILKTKFKKKTKNEF